MAERIREIKGENDEDAWDRGNGNPYTVEELFSLPISSSARRGGEPHFFTTSQSCFANAGPRHPQKCHLSPRTSTRKAVMTVGLGDPVELYRARSLPEVHAIRLVIESVGIAARIDGVTTGNVS